MLGAAGGRRNGVDEDAECPLEMAGVDDQEPVETFGSDGADEAFGDRVRLWCSDRRADDFDRFAAEDGVELARELAVASRARANTRSCLRMGQIPLTLGPSRD